MLNSIGYARMDRMIGAPAALAYVREPAAIEPPAASFDAAFSSSS
ncbi:AP endonuclease family 2 C terminus [Actinacidiphila alni]|uniref:AP endonuclease family 2 C terminus n=1 Tax=Actinacidiphila alni TaxID=380248 RepID=A0A1I2EHP5_9ACTN|nr:AP endonuclease family 2 C terminus [Actinacidiphila alni]